jgi:hypothetical protein
MDEHNELVCQHRSPVPSLAKGPEMAVAGEQMAAALAFMTPIEAAKSMSSKATMDRRLTDMNFSPLVE